MKIDYKGFEVFVDKADYPLFKRHNWTIQRNKGKRNKYLTTTIQESGEGKTRSLHRLMMSPPTGMQVDHINGNGLDNRRKNLRVCTQVENQRNTYKHRAGRLVGTYLTTNKNKKWAAQGSRKGRMCYIGVADTEEEAHKLYLKWLKTSNDE